MDQANSPPGNPVSHSDRAAGLHAVPIDSIIPDPEQPRKIYDEQSLDELAETIKEIGIIQAPVVRPVAKRGRYILVAGERRWRAAKIAGLKEIDVKIHEGDDYRSVALIENLQREDLTPVEEAAAVNDLIEQDPNINQSNVWQIIGKSRQTVNQLLKINSLPRIIRTESTSLSIPKTILIELSQLSDVDEQLRLWEQAKEGKLRVSDIRSAKPRRAAAKKTSERGASKLASIDQAIREGDKFFGTLADLDLAKMSGSDRNKLSELATTLARTFSSLKRKLSQSEGSDF
ncbi:MAG: ParB/RepB/Spo0J family partition protein [Alphaproteobacteria bacterium]|nr:ParB/RepB/Spo0J family partition protein [Alphaproteobacteria bacterium]